MNILLLGSYRERLKCELSKKHRIDVIEEYETEKISSSIAEADLVVIRSPHRLTRQLIEKADRLKWIVRAGSGLDNISDHYRERKIQLIRSSVNARSVAELAVLMLLALSRSLIPAHRSICEGRWIKSRLKGREVEGSSLGILGFGLLGQNLARMAVSLGMEVRIYDRSPFKEAKKDLLEHLSISAIDLGEILKSSDFVVVALPYNCETHRLIDAEKLALMRENAVIINIGRGGVMDIDALYEALRSGKLAGAGIDVYEVEPPRQHPIFHLDNVVCTPHIGGQTTQAKERATLEILRLVKELEAEDKKPWDSLEIVAVKKETEGGGPLDLGRHDS